MTPELRRLLGQRARQLQTLLNDPGADPVSAAEIAREIFTDAADDVRTRWLNLELNGYGELVDVQPLHLVLRVPTNDRLAGHVTAYRTQRGLTIGTGAAREEFRHFFVESLPELVRARDAVQRSSSASLVELEFAPHPTAPLHPKKGSFSRDVFERVVSGFIAALHLQLGALA